MILAVLDDLMFSSKIKTAANGLGVDLRFSRSVDGAIETMRKNPTTLVIFDLNNERIGPLAIVAAMKQDPALASIPTVGYASHVQTEVIDAARQVGRDHQAAPVHAIDDHACQRSEDRHRQELHDHHPRDRGGRAGQVEDQGVDGDGVEPVAELRNGLADVEQPEVAVVPQD